MPKKNTFIASVAVTAFVNIEVEAGSESEARTKLQRRRTLNPGEFELQDTPPSVLHVEMIELKEGN